MEENGVKVTSNDMLHYVYSDDYAGLTLCKYTEIILRVADDIQPCRGGVHYTYGTVG